MQPESVSDYDIGRAQSTEYRAQSTDNKTDLALQPQSQPKPESQSQESDDVLLVPAKVARAEAVPVMVAAPSGDIIVEKGDTVYFIAKAHNVPLRDFLDENKISAPYAISVGQKLRLPSARIHTVKAGETLYSISRGYSVDLNSLASLNNLGAPYSLAVGQKLTLPATMVVSGIADNRAQSTENKVQITDNRLQSTENKVQSTENKMPQPQPQQAKPVVTTPAKISSASAKPLPQSDARSAAKFAWPVRGKILSDFGVKKNGLYNDGINISAVAGTKVGAADNGVVAYAGNELKGMGNLVIIQHSGGWMTVYAHLDSIAVARGAKVVVGDKIGTVGKTGKVSEPQLHFEIRKGTKAYDPKKELAK
jgi:murein DD-endopeptidase MepM/ murein hydrolase activator NlpD